MSISLVMLISIVVLVALFLTTLRLHSQQLNSLEDFRARWQQIDVEAFANLLDPSEERYLKQTLPEKEFRRICRKRAIVAWEYVGRVGINARLMVQAGQIIQHHNSGEEAMRARQHVKAAMQLRMYVFYAQVALLGTLLFPQTPAMLQRVLQLYGNVAHSFDNVLDTGLQTVKM